MWPQMRRINPEEGGARLAVIRNNVSIAVRTTFRRAASCWIRLRNILAGKSDRDSWSGIQCDFIVSTGRTGTMALARLCAECFGSQVDSRHEPHPDLFHLAAATVRHGLTTSQVIRELGESRRHVLSDLRRKKCRWYVESNNNLAWLIPAVRSLFPHYRIIHIVRDGRDVVRSWYGKYVNSADSSPAVFAGPNDVRQRIGANDVPSDEYHSRWESMGRFERLCWIWSRTDAAIQNAIDGDDRCCTIRFEDIFGDKEEFAGAVSLISFLANGRAAPADGFIRERMRVRSNASEAHALPHWSAWPQEMQATFAAIAGSQMRRNGYSLD